MIEFYRLRLRIEERSILIAYDVTAVEPAQMLRQLGENYCGGRVKWLSDSLPRLISILDNTFDLVLVSAVWMHLTESQQLASLSRINSVISDGGILVITLRHGVFDDIRTSEMIDVDITLLNAQKLGFTCILNQRQNDKLNRSDVAWQTLVLTKLGEAK
jgi:hypothetical protein